MTDLCMVRQPASDGLCADRKQLNYYLGDFWPAPPWSAEQFNTVAMSLALAYRI